MHFTFDQESCLNYILVILHSFHLFKRLNRTLLLYHRKLNYYKRLEQKEKTTFTCDQTKLKFLFLFHSNFDSKILHIS
jgi:hypothetical protein